MAPAQADSEIIGGRRGPALLYGAENMGGGAPRACRYLCRAGRGRTGFSPLGECGRGRPGAVCRAGRFVVRRRRPRLTVRS